MRDMEGVVCGVRDMEGVVCGGAEGYGGSVVYRVMV